MFINIFKQKLKVVKITQLVSNDINYYGFISDYGNY